MCWFISAWTNWLKWHLAAAHLIEFLIFLTKFIYLFLKNQNFNFFKNWYEIHFLCYHVCQTVTKMYLSCYSELRMKNWKHKPNPERNACRNWNSKMQSWQPLQRDWKRSLSHYRNSKIARYDCHLVANGNG